MIKIIEFLQNNPMVLDLLKQEKISLVGVSAIESKAIVEAFEEDLSPMSAFWI